MYAINANIVFPEFKVEAFCAVEIDYSPICEDKNVHIILNLVKPEKHQLKLTPPKEI